MRKASRHHWILELIIILAAGGLAIWWVRCTSELFQGLEIWFVLVTLALAWFMIELVRVVKRLSESDRAASSHTETSHTAAERVVNIVAIPGVYASPNLRNREFRRYESLERA